MKLFLALMILAGAIAYSLDRGVYVGSEIIKDEQQYWRVICSHLYPSGVVKVRSGGHYTEQEAKERERCKVFRE